MAYFSKLTYLYIALMHRVPSNARRPTQRSTSGTRVCACPATRTGYRYQQSKCSCKPHTSATQSTCTVWLCTRATIPKLETTNAYPQPSGPGPITSSISCRRRCLSLRSFSLYFSAPPATFSSCVIRTRCAFFACVRVHVTRDMCHVSCVMCHVSCGMCMCMCVRVYKCTCMYVRVCLRVRRFEMNFYNIFWFPFWRI